MIEYVCLALLGIIVYLLWRIEDQDIKHREEMEKIKRRGR